MRDVLDAMERLESLVALPGPSGLARLDSCGQRISDRGGVTGLAAGPVLAAMASASTEWIC